MTEGLTATFVKHAGRRDRVYVTRADGTTTGWDFPGYGHELPHDLCHLVVEAELGLTDGFWGLVSCGTEVGLVDNQATLMRDGRPLGAQPGADLSGLLAAEAAVAAFSGVGTTMREQPGAEDPFDPEVAARIKQRLAELWEQWAGLEEGGSITLRFPGA